jgi:cytochrome c oxidase subunit 2
MLASGSFNRRMIRSRRELGGGAESSGRMAPNRRSRILWIGALVAVALAAPVTGLRAASAGAGAAPDPKLVKRGKALFSSYSCGACHTIDGRGGAGPTIKHLYGSKVKLTTGKTVIATDAYLLESIRDPDRKIVAGRPAGVMTTVIRKGQVPLKDALALVAYIKSLR